MNDAVLAFHIGSLGDTLLTIPALRAIRATWPGRRVVLLTNRSPAGRAGTTAVLDGEPLIDEFIEFDADAPALRRTLGALGMIARIRRAGCRTGVFLGPSLRPAAALARDARFFRLGGITELVGFRTVRNAPDIALAAGVAPNHEAALKLQRLRDDGLASAERADLWGTPFLTLSPTEQQQGAALVAGRDATRPLVALALSAGWRSKEWGPDRFEALAARLLRAGASVAIVGSAVEHDRASAICERVGAGLNLCGATARVTAAVMHACAAAVAADSGQAHLASVMGCPVVVVSWAGLPAGQWDPVGGRTVLRQHVPCDGCAQRECPVAGHPCMSNTSVDDVWAALEPWLDAWRAR